MNFRYSLRGAASPPPSNAADSGGGAEVTGNEVEKIKNGEINLNWRADCPSMFVVILVTL